MTLRFLTAGESHGPRLTVIIDGVPAGLELRAEDLAPDLQRRQGGHGRGGRMRIESDTARIVSGVRDGRTLGAPITLDIENRDFENWRAVMAVEPGAKRKPITRVRPGHADLAGMLKYGATDARDVLERASARETAARVAAGAVARRLLQCFDIAVHSYTRAIGVLSKGRRSAAPIQRQAPRWCRRSMLLGPRATRSAGSSPWLRMAFLPDWAAISSGTLAWTAASPRP